MIWLFVILWPLACIAGVIWFGYRSVEIELGWLRDNLEMHDEQMRIADEKAARLADQVSLNDASFAEIYPRISKLEKVNNPRYEEPAEEPVKVTLKPRNWRESMAMIERAQEVKNGGR